MDEVDLYQNVIDMVTIQFTFPSLEVNGVGDNVFQLHEFQFARF